MRLLLTILVYLLSLVVTGALAFIFVLVLAGPHAGIFPSWIEAVILGLGWLAVLLVPVWVALLVWRRVGKSR